MSTALKAIWQQAQSGERDAAIRQLTEMLRADGENVPAWLMMAALVEDPTRKAACCERVLRLDPDNRQARAWLRELQPAPEPAPAPEPPPEPPPVPPTTTAVSLTCPNCQAAMDARPGPPPYGFCGYCGTEVDLTRVVSGDLSPQALAAAVLPPGARQAAREEERAEKHALTEMIVAELGGHASSNALIEKVCKQTGWDWQESQRFVQRIEVEHEGEIVKRQTPLVLLFMLVSAVGGAGMLILGVIGLVRFRADRLDTILWLIVAGFGTLCGSLIAIGKTLRKRGAAQEDW